MADPGPPTRRSDAERNRARILAAAHEAFADPDADVSMAEVARRSGVGSATLYRNFAGKQELLEALYRDEIDGVCAAAEQPDGDTPEDRLTNWLRRFYAYFTSKRPVATELLKHSSADDPMFTGGYARVIAAGRPLLKGAQRAGTVRKDLALEQVLHLIVAVAKIEGDERYREPMLQAVLDGLRTRG